MPFYRIDSMVVHIKGTKLPPACRALLGMEGTAQDLCGAISGYLCDGPHEDRLRRLNHAMSGKGHLTCDLPLCEAHAWQLAENKHLCPAHRLEHLDAQAQRGLFTSLV